MARLILIFLLYSAAFHSQNIALSEIWWSWFDRSGRGRTGDTVYLNREQKEVYHGIYFNEKGKYKMMTGWEYCGTYVHKHHLKENPPLYKEGNWKLNRSAGKTFLFMDEKKYLVLSSTENRIILLLQ